MNETFKKTLKQQIADIEEASKDWKLEDYSIAIESSYKILNLHLSDLEFQKCARQAVIKNPRVNKYTAKMEYEYKDKDYIQAHKRGVLAKIDNEIEKHENDIALLKARILFFEDKYNEIKSIDKVSGKKVKSKKV